MFYFLWQYIKEDRDPQLIPGPTPLFDLIRSRQEVIIFILLFSSKEKKKERNKLIIKIHQLTVDTLFRRLSIKNTFLVLLDNEIREPFSLYRYSQYYFRPNDKKRHSNSQ